MMSPVMLLVVFICLWISHTESYNILGVFPVRAYSHFVILNSISVELAKRGHNVTVYSRYLNSYEEGTYKHVELTDCFPLKNDNSKYNSIEYISGYGGILGFIMYVLNFIPSAEDIENCKPLMELINTTNKYDLLLLEAYNGNTDIYTGLAYKFKIPYVSVSSTMLYPWLSERIGTPDNPSYVPVPYTGFTSEMNFMERTINTVTYLMSKIIYNYASIPQSEKVAKKVFGESLPPLRDILENCSLMFTYTHNSINPVRPLVPNIVEIAGVNIKNVNQLPKNIEKFINESAHGVVYFSMGSFIHSRLFPREKLEAFLYAFSKIPQRVVWKWESDSMPVNSDKILTAPWMPQNDILAHPNIKLFISHGGLLGINEAVHAGVPVLGIPVFADQSTNVNMLKMIGAGDILHYKDISKDVVLQKVTNILNISSYHHNARDLSIRYKDRPLSAQDTVAYWVEYVIKHNGAHHLRTAAVEMPFYQYLLLDVIVVICTIFIVFFVIGFLLFKLLFMTLSIWIQRIFNRNEKIKTN